MSWTNLYVHILAGCMKSAKLDFFEMRLPISICPQQQTFDVKRQFEKKSPPLGQLAPTFGNTGPTVDARNPTPPKNSRNDDSPDKSWIPKVNPFAKGQSSKRGQHFLGS